MQRRYRHVGTSSPGTNEVCGFLTVNGERIQVQGTRKSSLLDVLRRDLDLTGAKRGCDIGVCGTCTVLVDNRSKKSCSYLLSQAISDQADVVTIEALGPESLHPMQRAFIDHAAVQCGYCTPGLILAAEALTRRKSSPSEDDVAQLLKSQLCRCTGYRQIIDAIIDGAGRMRGEAATITDTTSWRRSDAVDKVRGTCKYTPDLRRDGMVHAVVIRSDRPHAEVVSIDGTDALALPGVLRLLTHEDVQGEKYFGNAIADQPCLAVDRVRHVGDPVAILVADDPTTARAAAQRVAVTYRTLPAVVSPRDALLPGAPQLHPGGNVASHQRLQKGDAEAGMAQADVVVSGRFETPFQEHACLESEAALAWIEGHQLIVAAPSQNVYFDRREIARITGWQKKHVVVRQQPMGAAFGKREDLYCQHHAAVASMAMGGIPVRVEMSREETFVATTKRHAFSMDYEIGASSDGRILAIRAELYADTGAYASWAPNVLRKALVHAAGAYDVDNVSIEARSVYTNNTYAGAFRGFGAPQVFFAIESLVDELAEKLSLAPVMLRRKNMLRLGGHTATNQELTASVGLSTCLDAAVGRLGPCPPSDERWRRGIGVAIGFYGIGYGNGIPDIGSAILELLADGRVQLRISTVDYGQGSSTLFPQIVCRELQLERAQVDLVTGDSSQCPDSGSTVASRQTYVSGNAVLLACARFRKKVASAAAVHLGVDAAEVVIGHGVARTADHVLSFADLAAAQGSQKTQARFRARTRPLDPSTGQGDAYWPYAFGAQAAQVAVDTHTGRVVVERLVAAQDVGCALNHQMVEGQIRGAVAMGIGFALLENYRVVDGYPLDVNFDTYKLPLHDDMPDIQVEIVEDPEPTGPYGAKGVGEPPIVATAPAIANAVADAIGVRLRRLPLSRERVLAAIDKTPPAEPAAYGMTGFGGSNAIP